MKKQQSIEISEDLSSQAKKKKKKKNCSECGSFYFLIKLNS